MGLNPGYLHNLFYLTIFIGLFLFTKTEMQEAMDMTPEEFDAAAHQLLASERDGSLRLPRGMGLPVDPSWGDAEEDESTPLNPLARAPQRFQSGDRQPTDAQPQPPSRSRRGGGRGAGPGQGGGAGPRGPGQGPDEVGFFICTYTVEWTVNEVPGKVLKLGTW